jgi:hypothetical protein
MPQGNTSSATCTVDLLPVYVEARTDAMHDQVGSCQWRLDAGASLTDIQFRPFQITELPK